MKIENVSYIKLNGEKIWLLSPLKANCCHCTHTLWDKEHAIQQTSQVFSM